jgi:prevent-host-death family protein
METIGVFEAKTHFSELIDGVEHGGEYVITRHGKPVARLVGAKVSDRQVIEETIDALLEFRKGRKADQKEIKEWMMEGRRF